MLSIPAVLREAYPLNRKLDLEFETLCHPADLTFIINFAKNQQNMATFNYNALDETLARPGVKTSPTDSAHIRNPTSTNWAEGE